MLPCSGCCRGGFAAGYGEELRFWRAVTRNPPRGPEAALGVNLPREVSPKCPQRRGLRWGQEDLGPCTSGAPHLEASHVGGEVAHLGGSHIWGSYTSVSHICGSPSGDGGCTSGGAHTSGGVTHRGTGATRGRASPSWPRRGLHPAPPRLGKLRHDPSAGTPSPLLFGGIHSSPKPAPPGSARACLPSSPNTPKGGRLLRVIPGGCRAPGSLLVGSVWSTNLGKERREEVSRGGTA